MGGPLGLTGGCTCGRVRYRLTAAPLITHACHCTWCQRETGSAFVINLWMETAAVELLGEAPVPITLPSASGKGQTVYRCAACQVAVYSEYDVGPAFRFVRGGTLDRPGAVRPDVQIFTGSKQDWVPLAPDIPAYEGFYRRSDVWRAEALERFNAVRKAG